MSDFGKMSLAELRTEGKKLGIKNVTTYKKQELLEKILEMAKNSSNNGTVTEEPGSSDRNNKAAKKAPKDNRTENEEEKTRRAERNRGIAKNSGSSNNNNSSNSNNNNGNNYNNRNDQNGIQPSDMEQLDSGEVREGILEVMQEGYGFIRCDNYLPGDEDVYVSPALIRKYHLRTGDILKGNVRVRNQNEKFGALLYIRTVNGVNPDRIIRRVKFEQLTPIFPNERIRLEIQGGPVSMRMMDLISPIGKGQRGMIVSQPKTGKTTLLKQVAKAVKTNHPKMHLIVLLIDERPEEVTDIKESIMGNNVDVIYSTFDELPENHKRVSEMVIERAKRLVEHGEDVMIQIGRAHV